MTKITFKMEPFNCPSCVKKIETTLARQAGVKEVQVMFHSNQIRIQAESPEVSAVDLATTLGKLGYPVLSTKVS
ncbi:heavy-metal-associated domain-containing protein [Alcaligenaceae bacterium]|nr:heavy-metal-associated domain-containing protein [Alcaligenaceae bacterium]